MMNLRSSTLCLLGMIAISCQKNSETPIVACNQKTNRIEGQLNDQHWCAEIYELHPDQVGALLINASRESIKEYADIEQMTISIANFTGIGEYDLLQGDGYGMYREWCCGDMITYLAYTGMQAGDTGIAIVSEYDTETREISGTVEFQSSDSTEVLVRFSGSFQGVVRDE